MAVGKILRSVAGVGTWSKIDIIGNLQTSVTVPRQYRGFIFFCGPEIGLFGLYGLFSTSGGMGSNASIPLAAAQKITLSTGGDTLTVTNSSGSTAQAIFFTAGSSNPT